MNEGAESETPQKESFESPAPRFPLYNLHPASIVDPIRGFLRRDPGPSVLLLSGEEGIGRRYVLQAVAEEMRQESIRKPLVLQIDLECFDETRPYSSLVELSIERYAGGRIQSQEVARAIEDLSKVASKTVPEAAFLEMVLKLAQSSLLPVLKRFVASADVARSKLPGEERVLQLLRSMANAQPMIIHLVHPTRARAVFRDRLCEGIEGCTGLGVALSCHPMHATHRLAPVRKLRHEPLRLELGPLTSQDLQDSIERRFPDNELPPELFDALERYSDGLPGLAAAKFHQLISGGQLFRNPAGHLAPVEDVKDLIGDSFREVLTRRILALVDRPEIKTTNAARLRRMLENAALCGRLVPLQLLLDDMGVEGDDKDELLDLVDDHLVEGLGIFLEHWPEHPEFPGIPMVEFVDPLERYGLLHRLDSWERAETARGLLKFLKRAIKVQSFGAAHLFQELAFHLEDPEERQHYLEGLDWWISMEESEALRDLLIEKVRQGEVEHEALWNAANLRDYWPAYRRMAVLEAYEGLAEIPEATKGEVDFPLPWDRQGPLWHLKAHLLFKLGDYKGSLAFATQAEEWFEKDQLEALSSKLQRHLAELLLGRFQLAKNGFETLIRAARELAGEDSDSCLQRCSISLRHTISRGTMRKPAISKSRSWSEGDAPWERSTRTPSRPWPTSL